MSDFNTYQANIRQFAVYHKELGPFSVIMDLTSNVGILSNKLYNVLEDKEGTFTREEKIRIAISLGDIVNNVANMASDLDITFDEVISLNLKKHELGNKKTEIQ